MGQVGWENGGSKDKHSEYEVAKAWAGCDGDGGEGYGSRRGDRQRKSHSEARQRQCNGTSPTAMDERTAHSDGEEQCGHRLIGSSRGITDMQGEEGQERGRYKCVDRREACQNPSKK